MYVRYPVDPDFRPEPNLAYQTCHTYACYTHPFTDPDCMYNREFFTSELNIWAEKANHLFVYEYYIKTYWGDLPWPILRNIEQEIPYYHKVGAEAFFTQCQNDKFFIYGLNFYIPAKLLWDTSQSLDTVLTDYCESFYGPAGGAMKEYFLTYEDAMVQSDIHISPYMLQAPPVASYQVFTPAILDRAGMHLEQAEHMADTDLYRRRVHLSRVSYNYTSMVMNYLKQIGEPFKNIDENNNQAMQTAAAQAKRIGEPLAMAIKAYLKSEMPFYVDALGDENLTYAQRRNHVNRMLSTHLQPNRIPEIGLRKPVPDVEYLQMHF